MNATLSDILSQWATYQPNKAACIFLRDGEEESAKLTYGELERKAKAIAHRLKPMRGERALLLYPSGLDFITAFFGCLYAGVIAVPVYLPRRSQKLSRLLAIVNDSEAKVALTTISISTRLEEKWVQESELAQLELIATDAILPSHGDLSSHTLATEKSLAFLQYTSGSTGIPKGVMVTHDNIIHNQKSIQQALCHDENTVQLVWLPLFHDMGLIGNILQTIYLGTHCILMPPTAFLMKPVRWMNAISKYKATTSGGPNFAYDLCVHKVTPEQLDGVDLSSWNVAFNGAEPVRADTIKQFSGKFAQYGFKSSAFYPCYGMAETTLLATGGAKFRKPVLKNLSKKELEQNSVTQVEVPFSESRTLVGCGHPLLDTDIRIVDVNSLTQCESSKVGEVWISGDSVARGYWHRPQQTQETFQAYLTDIETGQKEGPFLKTGDLGFLLENELFITGRLKDVVIVRGRNHYPQDIEFTVESCHEALQPSSGAAFSVEAESTERLVIVQEVKRSYLRRLRDNVVVDEIVSTICQAVLEEHDLQPYAIRLIRPASLPKTSSGKVQRRQCRKFFLDKSLKTVATWQQRSPKKKLVVEEARRNKQASLEDFSGKAQGRVQVVEDWIVQWIGHRIGLPPSEISCHKPFASYGFDSLQAVEMAASLESFLKRSVSPTLLYDFPTIQALARQLVTVESTKALPCIEQAPNRHDDDDIAVIGMGCRFPGASDLQSFWKLLREGQDAITEVPISRWDANEISSSVDTQVSRWGGFLEKVDQFDSLFFGISPREATCMDPQQRLLLEVCWETLENAGISVEYLSGSLSGVFVGISNGGDYARVQGSQLNTDTYYGTGLALSVAANRVSYVLDWRGPSYAIDTACSSSLVAVHQACQSIRAGECNFALAGGVNLITSPQLTVTFSKANMMAADGRCKTFDKSADGYVRSEGCGIVALKRLSEARLDGDTILGIIPGSATNQDGRSNGLTAPNGLAQQNVVRQAWNNANVKGSQVDYIEAHGTGTPLGDLIEVNALKALLASDTNVRTKPCWLGSVKTNIGHLESAAGIAGLIKVLLSLQNKEIPPHLHIQAISSHIQLDNTPLKIPTKLRSWPVGAKQRLAGVSSFGFGGTNAHVLVAEAPEEISSAPTVLSESLPERPLHILTLSAKDKASLEAVVSRYQLFLKENEKLSLADICFTANVGRSHFRHRLAVVAANRKVLVHKLSQIGSRGKTELPDVFSGELSIRHTPPKIAFLFTGQGSQYIDMGKELYETQLVFRQTINQCDQILQPYINRSLIDILYPKNSQERNQSALDQTSCTQVALFAFEYALACLWKSWGVSPDVVMGHSIGEYVAAAIAGVFSLEDGLKLVAHRGRLMQRLRSGGHMLAISASLGKVRLLISTYSELEIAAINGPASIVISGTAQAINRVQKALKEEAIVHKKLQVSHAFHSFLMEPMLSEFKAIVDEVTFHQPRIPLISNTTGAKADESITTASYWVGHMRHPVMFAKGIESLEQEGCQLFLEVGPKPILVNMGKRCSGETSSKWLHSLSNRESDWQQMLRSLSSLYSKGVSISWEIFDKAYSRRKVLLPNYPWQRQRYWASSNSLSSHQKLVKNELHPLLGQRLHLAGMEDDIRFQCTLGTGKLNYLQQHRVFSVPVFPASAYLEIALEAGSILFGSEALVLEEVTFEEALIVSEDKNTNIQVVLNLQDSQSYSFKIFSLELGSPRNRPVWVLHAQGKLIDNSQTKNRLGTLDLETIKAEHPREISREAFYQAHKHRGLHYGEFFQAVQHIWEGNGKALGKLHLSERLLGSEKAYYLHPVLLDAGFQLLSTALGTTENQETYLPVSVKKVQVYRSVGKQLWAQAKIDDFEANAQILVGNVCLFDEQGNVVAKIEELVLLRTSHHVLKSAVKQNIEDHLYEICWKPQPFLPAEQLESIGTGSWLLLSPSVDTAKHLLDFLEEKGHRCILVTPGKSYQKLKERHYQIDPLDEDNFSLLLKESLAQQPPLRGVVHLWSLRSPTASLKSAQLLDKSQELACGSVLHLVQALVTGSYTTNVSLWLVTKGAQAVEGDLLPVQFQQASLWGLGRVITQEHRELCCRCVDLDPTVESDQAVSALAQALLSCDNEDQISYRNQVRYVARLKRRETVAFQNGKSLLSLQQQPFQQPLQTDSSYLITGGLGALGLKTAKWMVEQGACYIILAARSRPKAHVQKEIEQIRKLGAQVLVLHGDISREQDVVRILKSIKEVAPPLKGIIHAAGVLSDSLLQHSNWKRFVQVMEPKVRGAWLLHHLTQEIPLDFFVFFSSISALLGSPGQGNYAAANEFMNALAEYRRAVGMPGLSIAWGPWSEGGMATSLGGQHQERISAKGIDLITPALGFRTLSDLLPQAAGCVGAVPINWAQFLKQYHSGEKMPLIEMFSSTHQAIGENSSQLLTQLKDSPETSRAKVLSVYLKKKVAESLRMMPSQVDIQQPLNTMGLDSLIAMDLRNQLQTSLSVSIPVTRFIEDVSITDLVVEVDRQLASIDSAQLADKKDSQKLLSVGEKDNSWIEVDL